jgi:hypothetical protein
LKAARLSQRGNRRATTNAMNEKRLQSLRDLAASMIDHRRIGQPAKARADQPQTSTGRMRQP